MLAEYEKEQPIAYKILSNSILNQHLTHAYIFETNGYEKGLDMALSFAKALLCPNHYKDNHLCSDCFQCKMIDDNNYLELNIINPDGQVIKKEQLLDLQEEFNKKSLLGNKKIYIINHADKLNNTSANAILKFIEEPPENIIAILVVDNVYQLLNTIVSRCQIVSLSGQANIKDSDTTVSKVGKLLCNNVCEYEEFINNSFSMIDQVIEFINYYETNGEKILLSMNEYWFNNFCDKDTIYKALQIMLFFYKDCLNVKININIDVFNDYNELITKISNMNDLKSIIKKINVINNNKYFISNNANLNLLMDRIVIEMGEGD